MAMEILADFSLMEKAYREEIDEETCNDTLSINDCFILKYLLETFESWNSTMIQFGIGAGVEFKAIGQCLRKGYRILLVDHEAEENEAKQCLTTPLDPLDAVQYLSEVIGKVSILFINEYNLVDYYFKRYEELLIQNGYVAVHLKKGQSQTADLLGYLSDNPRYQKLFETEQLVIYRLIEPSQATLLEGYNQYMRRKLKAIYKRVSEAYPMVPTVGLGVLTYNHAPHIVECLDGVFNQTGNFKKKVVIVDDDSNDGTSELIDEYLREHESLIGDTQVVLVHNSENLGALKSIEILFQELRNSTDFFSYIEGDDYWCSSERTQIHMDILLGNPQFAFSVNAFKLLFQDKNRFVSGDRFSKLQYTRNNTYDIILNYIGNAGCYFYRSSLLYETDFEKVKRMQIEWQLVLLLSLRGDCYFVEDELNVYRKHSGGTWSTLEDEKKDLTKLGYLSDMNQELDLMFDDAFVNKCIDMMKGCFIAYKSRYDLIIFDEFFNSSGEYKIRKESQFLLEHIQLSTFAVDLYHMQFQTQNHALEILNQVRKKNPQLATRIWAMDGWHSLAGKILLTFDPQTAYMSLSICERYQIPFLFVIEHKITITEGELYRILDSEMFCGIILSDHLSEQSGLTHKNLHKDNVLILPKSLFGTSEGSWRILHFIQRLEKKIDYTTLYDERLLTDVEYAKRNGLYNQFHVWSFTVQHGRVYCLCKSIYNKFCPNRFKPFVKNIYRRLTGKL